MSVQGFAFRQREPEDHRAKRAALEVVEPVHKHLGIWRSRATHLLVRARGHGETPRPLLREIVDTLQHTARRLR